MNVMSVSANMQYKCDAVFCRLQCACVSDCTVDLYANDADEESECPNCFVGLSVISLNNDLYSFKFAQ